MSRWYIDTSAALKLLQIEAGSEQLVARISTDQPVLVSSHLLVTEMRRAAQRSPELSQEAVTRFLEKVDIVDLPAQVFNQAGLLPGPTLRSLDALHLAAALQTNVDHVVTYDTRMAEAAVGFGLRVLAPA